MASERARKLRKEMNEYERQLWSLLRMKRLAGYRFRRQHPIGPYTVDFFCPSAKLVVEQDGGHHFAEEAVYRDAARTKWLSERGYRVIRVTNHDVMRHPFDVQDFILRALNNPPSAPPANRTDSRSRSEPERGDLQAGHLPPQGGTGKNLGDGP